MTVLLLSVSALLGFLAFFEPCTIATHTLFAVRAGQQGKAARRKALWQLLGSRFLLSTFIIGAAIYFREPPQWTGYTASVILGLIAVIYVLSRKIYIPIPHLAFYRLLPGGRRLPDALQLGLTLPACTIPLFLTVAGLAVTVHQWVQGIWAAMLFTLFFSLPTIFSAVKGVSPSQREFLSRIAGVTPYVSAVLFLGAALFLLLPEMELNKATLELIMARPSLPALFIGFVAGLIFSFNPVSFTAIPVALAYVTRAHKKERARVMGLSFVGGLILTHVLLGLIAAAGGEWVKGLLGREWAAVLGVILLFLGLLWAGWLKINLPWFGLTAKKAGSLWGAFLLGIPFAIAVCPFCSPALLVMLTASAAIGSLGFGVLLLLSFALGRSIPVLLGAWSMAWLESLTFFTKWQKAFERGGGILLLLSGLYLLNQYYFII